MNVKLITLVLLVAQTTTLILTLRYSRTVKQDGPRYLSSTVVLLAELLKFLGCLAIITWEKGSFQGLVHELREEIIKKPFDGLKIAIPSGTYAFQNNLLFIALSYLDSATYQVTYQLKILSSAIFSVGLLGKRLSAVQWVSLVMLMVGVALVQMPNENEAVKEREYRWYGVIAILTSCVSSGFAGVYFEKLLKGSTVSLWIRNVEMAFFGMFFSSIGTYLNDKEAIRKDGFFQGYNGLVCFIICLHAFGGLLVSTVIKFADNIIKGFAASLSIIISSLMALLFFKDFNPTIKFILGTMLVLLATFLYGMQNSRKSSNEVQKTR